jgi:hypothetical protein
LVVVGGFFTVGDTVDGPLFHHAQALARIQVILVACLTGIAATETGQPMDHDAIALAQAGRGGKGFL